MSIIQRHPARSAGIAGAAVLGVALLTLSLQSAPTAETALAQEVEEVAVAETEPSAEAAPESLPLASAPLPTIEKATRIALLEPVDTSPGLPDDARWAAAGNSAPARSAASGLAELLGERQQDRETDLDAFAQAFDLEPDRSTTTAAIDPVGDVDGQTAVAVAIAESEVEVAALESRMAAQNQDVFDTAASGPVGQGVVTSYVNLRAAPENEADILKVLPENAAVSVIDDCPNWCEVEHEGTRGFVYGSYVDRQTPSNVSAVDQLQ